MLRLTLYVAFKFGFVFSEVLKEATTYDIDNARKLFKNYNGLQNMNYHLDNINEDALIPTLTDKATVKNIILKTVYADLSREEDNPRPFTDHVGVFTDIRFLMNRNRGVTKPNQSDVHPSVRSGLPKTPEPKKFTDFKQKIEVYDYLNGFDETTPGLDWLERSTSRVSPTWTTVTVTEPTTPIQTEPVPEATTTVIIETTTPLIKNEDWTVPMPDGDVGPTMPTHRTTDNTTQNKITNDEIKIGDALHGEIFITSTTKNPMAVELNENIEKLHVGMYTIFVMKVLDLLAKLDTEHLRELMFAMEWYTENQNMHKKPSGLNKKITELLVKLGRTLTISSPDYMRSFIILSKKMLEDRREEMAADTNAIYNMLDEIFDEDDAPEMLTTLETLKTYPQNNKTAYFVVTTVMNVILFVPSSKLLETPKHGILFDAIVTAVSKRYHGGGDLRRFATEKFSTKSKDYKKRGSKRTAKFKTTKQYFNNVKPRKTKMSNSNVDTVKRYETKVSKGMYKFQTLKHGKKIIKSNNNIQDTLKPKRYFVKPKRIMSKSTDDINQDGFKIRNLSDLDAENLTVVEKKKKLHEIKWDYAKKLLIKEIQQLASSEWKTKHQEVNKTKKFKKENKQRYYEHLKKKQTKYYTFAKVKRNNSEEINVRNQLHLNPKRKAIRKQNRLKSFPTKKDHLIFKESVKSLKENKENIAKKKVWKKIIQLSSVSDEEIILKRKVLDAMESQDCRKLFGKILIKNNNTFSSYSDEEAKLKVKIYKAFGIENDFNNVKT